MREQGLISRNFRDPPDAILELITDFMQSVKHDPRIGAIHISLYMALLTCYHEQRSHPIYIFSAQVMQLAKISGPTTYHRTMRDLAAFGYIRYVPSYYHLLGSLVYFPGLAVSALPPMLKKNPSSD